MPDNGRGERKPTRFLTARDWLHRPGYRFRVWRLSRKVNRLRRDRANAR